MKQVPRPHILDSELTERIAEVRQLYLDTLADWPVDTVPTPDLYKRARTRTKKKATPKKVPTKKAVTNKTVAKKAPTKRTGAKGRP